MDGFFSAIVKKWQISLNKYCMLDRYIYPQDIRQRMGWFCVLRLMIGLSFLLLASFYDLRDRKVKNWIWIAIGLCGIAILAAQFVFVFDQISLAHYLIFIPIIILFGSAFWDFSHILSLILYIAAFFSVLYQFFTLGLDPYFIQLLTIPIMLLVFYALYYSRLLHGGADAKALMSIAILVPFYPIFYLFPIINPIVVETTQLFFPFVFLVLLNAVLIQIVLPIGFIIYNAYKRDLSFPQCFFGYKMDIDKVKKKFVWLMEKIVDDEYVLVLFPKKKDDMEEEIKKLKEAKIERVWVTPQIPFIVPITIGFIISFFIGNLLFGLIQWLT